MAEESDKKQILCVGLLCFDVMAYCNQFPNEDSDNRCEDVRLCLGGNACNNLTVLSQIGSQAHLFACIAQDHTFPVVTSLLTQANIHSNYCIVRQNCKQPSSVVTVNMSNGSRTILHAHGNMQEPTIEEFSSIDIHKYSWIHFEGRNFSQVRKMIDYIVQNRKSPKCPVISVEVEKVRPYPTLEQLIPGADVVFMSKDFARNQGFQDMQSAVVGISEKYGDPGCTVVCAWAEKGAAAYCNGETYTSEAFCDGDIVDTCGAGDTFIAAMLHNMNLGRDIGTCLENACKLAGKKCTQKGLLNLV